MRVAVRSSVRLPARLVAVLAAVACLLGALPPAGALAAEPAAGDPALADALLARAAVRDALLDRPAPTGALLVTTEDAAGPALLERLPAVARAAASPRSLRSLAEAPAQEIAPGVTRLEVDPAEAEAVRAALAAVPGVVAAEHERVWELAATPDDRLFPQQWAHARAGAPAGWDILSSAAGRTIAVIDSGIDARHPELIERVVQQYVVRSTGSGLTVTSPGTGVDNATCAGGAAGHGTAVAGVAAATGNNGEGVAGVAWDAQVLDFAVISARDCTITDAKVIRALDEVRRLRPNGRPVDVVNLSLGGTETSGRCPAGLQQVIDRVVDQGTVVVAAAGNHGTLEFIAPAGCDKVIAVGATDPADRRAAYSGMSRYLDVVAPGGADSGCSAQTCVLTTGRITSSGATYVSANGTSFAAPYVAGMVALLRAERTNLTPAQIQSVLEQTARHPAGSGRHDHEHGWGLVHLGRALDHLRGSRAIPALREHPAVRLAEGPTTSPVPQAAAVSRASFTAGGARHAVVARADDFADALAGSSLAFGIGPLLFAPRRGGLPGATAAELRRTLEPASTVYLLGGADALDPVLEQQIRDLGLRPVRLEGKTRAETAVAVAREIGKTVGAPPAVMVTTAHNWPDAVAAGSFGAAFGLPILLTSRDALHGSTAAYLRELARGGGPAQVYAIGGTGVVGEDAARAAVAASGARQYARLAGAARDQTANAVAAEMRTVLQRAYTPPRHPPYAVAVDLDRRDSYAHALSASVVAGATFSVFVPVRGPSAPSRITGATAQAFCNLGSDPILAGSPDLLPDAVGSRVLEVLAGTRC